MKVTGEAKHFQLVSGERGGGTRIAGARRPPWPPAVLLETHLCGFRLVSWLLVSGLL